jgi:hypothetical protein
MTLAMFSWDQPLHQAPATATGDSVTSDSLSLFGRGNAQAVKATDAKFSGRAACLSDARSDSQIVPDYSNLLSSPHRSPRDSGRARSWAGFQAGFGRFFRDRPVFRGCQEPACAFLKISVRF